MTAEWLEMIDKISIGKRGERHFMERHSIKGDAESEK